MSDLIDRQAAIDALEWKWAWKAAIDAIKNLPSVQLEHRWIPVSERLPEKEGYYLTTTIFKEVYCDYWNGDNFDRTEMVISWMPLPEPWKGEEDA